MLAVKSPWWSPGLASVNDAVSDVGVTPSTPPVAVTVPAVSAASVTVSLSLARGRVRIGLRTGLGDHQVERALIAGREVEVVELRLGAGPDPCGSGVGAFVDVAEIGRQAGDRHRPVGVIRYAEAYLRGTFDHRLGR